MMAHPWVAGTEWISLFPGVSMEILPEHTQRELQLRLAQAQHAHPALESMPEGEAEGEDGEEWHTADTPVSAADLESLSPRSSATAAAEMASVIFPEISGMWTLGSGARG